MMVAALFGRSQIHGASELRQVDQISVRWLLFFVYAIASLSGMPHVVRIRRRLVGLLDPCIAIRLPCWSLHTQFRFAPDVLLLSLISSPFSCCTACRACWPARRSSTSSRTRRCSWMVQLKENSGRIRCHHLCVSLMLVVRFGFSLLLCFATQACPRPACTRSRRACASWRRTCGFPSRSRLALTPPLTALLFADRVFGACASVRV